MFVSPMAIRQLGPQLLQLHQRRNSYTNQKPVYLECLRKVTFKMQTPSYPKPFQIAKIIKFAIKDSLNRCITKDLAPQLLGKSNNHTALVISLVHKGRTFPKSFLPLHSSAGYWSSDLICTSTTIPIRQFSNLFHLSASGVCSSHFTPLCNHPSALWLLFFNS